MSGLEDCTDTIGNLAEIILAAQNSITPSELHGFVCGALATGARPGHRFWKRELAALLNLDTTPADFECQTNQLVQLSLEKLRDKAFNFRPLLPDTQTPGALSKNLCAWCEGFLHGFGIGKFTGKLLPTSSEALTDLAEIAQLDTALPDRDAETDAQLFEVQEYVRVAALNIFIECSEIPTANRGEHRVH